MITCNTKPLCIGLDQAPSKQVFFLKVVEMDFSDLWHKKSNTEAANQS